MYTNTYYTASKLLSWQTNKPTVVSKLPNRAWRSKRYLNKSHSEKYAQIRKPFLIFGGQFITFTGARPLRPSIISDTPWFIEGYSPIVIINLILKWYPPFFNSNSGDLFQGWFSMDRLSRENLHRKPSDFPIFFYGVFRLNFSLNSIHWLLLTTIKSLLTTINHY